MQNSQVSFKSNIKFMPNELFLKEVERFGQFKYVNYPGTSKEIVRSPYAATGGIKTCTAGGILVRNDKSKMFDVVMFHITPFEEANSNFKTIERVILDEVGFDQPIQGFLLGSKKIFKLSSDFFTKFETLMHKLNIPYSKFKGIPTGNADYVDLAYSARDDQWSVFASAINHINADEIVKNFDDVFISEKDKLIF